MFDSTRPLRPACYEGPRIPICDAQKTKETNVEFCSLQFKRRRPLQAIASMPRKRSRPGEMTVQRLGMSNAVAHPSLGAQESVATFTRTWVTIRAHRFRFVPCYWTERTVNTAQGRNVKFRISPNLDTASQVTLTTSAGSCRILIWWTWYRRSLRSASRSSFVVAREGQDSRPALRTARLDLYGADTGFSEVHLDVLRRDFETLW